MHNTNYNIWIRNMGHKPKPNQEVTSRLGPSPIGPGRLGPVSQSIGPGQLDDWAHPQSIRPTWFILALLSIYISCCKSIGLFLGISVSGMRTLSAGDYYRRCHDMNDWKQALRLQTHTICVGLDFRPQLSSPIVLVDLPGTFFVIFNKHSHTKSKTIC